MSNLHAVIQRVRNNQFDNSDWLYIAGPEADLNLSSEAELECPDFDEDTDEEIEPTGFGERGLRLTIDVETMSQCIELADRLSRSQDNHAAADIIRYYIRFDAWPETLNAADPPSGDIVLRRVDREFVEKLGPEDSAKTCRGAGCTRGVVRFTLFCRRHHFENVYNRPYPFED